MNDELRDRLRATADGYEPDRDRMWERVSDGMRAPRDGAAEPERTRSRVPHLALATGAAVLLIGGIVLFGRSFGLGPVSDPTAGPAPADPGTRTGETSQEAAGEESESAAGGPSDSGSSEGQQEETESEATAQDPEWLWADGSVDPGSNDYWTQSVLTFKNEEAVTGLEVELRIAGADGLEALDAWSTDDNLFVEHEPVVEDGYLVFRWTLKEGAVIPANGEYTLAGQFNHQDGPRSADGDSYTFTAETESGETGELTADFA